MKPIYKILLIINLLLSSGGQMFGQEKATISAGIGFPDLINIGIKYQVFNQAQIGLNIGYFPPFGGTGILTWGNLYSLSGDFYYHFAGSSEFSKMHPWYGRLGLNSFNGTGVEGSLDSNIRIGRDCYITKTCGISLEAGLMCHFNYKEYHNNMFEPSLGIYFFYRF